MIFNPKCKHDRCSLTIMNCDECKAHTKVEYEKVIAMQKEPHYFTPMFTGDQSCNLCGMPPEHSSHITGVTQDLD